MEVGSRNTSREAAHRVRESIGVKKTILTNHYIYRKTVDRLKLPQLTKTY